MRSRRAFATILGSGTRCRHGGVTVVAAPIGGERPMVGLVAGRKVGTAVTRNRAKRRLRAVLRSLDLEPGVGYVVIASSRVASAPFDDLLEWVTRAVRSAEEKAR